jgi:riboflavin kinase/FMN adenylyltransferase
MVLEGPWQGWDPPTGETSVTIGVLDGVHLGHRALLSRLDQGRRPTVLTFDPHPIEVLRPGTPPRLITTIEERVALLAQAGVELVGVLDLREIKEQSPVAFVEDVLVGKVRVGNLVVGEDFRFGKDRRGDVSLLKDLGDRHGFEVVTIGILGHDDSPVSSSRIRRLLEEGEVGEAAVMLGSWFTLTGTVVSGDRRGRELGFPTANLRPPERKLMPANGVYACFATVGADRHAAAVNVGVRPTFGGGELLVEAFMLDFDGEIYGEDLTVEFVRRLRPELAFDDVGELVDRMGIDVAETRAVLDATGSRM